MTFWLTTLIIIVTYIGIAIGSLPYLRVNRTTIALIGVGLLLALGLLSFDAIGPLLEINTLVLLFGMMIINANLQLSGFFVMRDTLYYVGQNPRAVCSHWKFLSWVFSVHFS